LDVHCGSSARLVAIGKKSTNSSPSADAGSDVGALVACDLSRSVPFHGQPDVADRATRSVLVSR
jgi:hypothetical protein